MKKKKLFYVFLLITMLIIDFVFYITYNGITNHSNGHIAMAIFAEVAIYATLIIFEILNNKNDD